MQTSSDTLFSRLAALPPAGPAPSWPSLLAGDAFAEPAALIRALRPARDRPDAALLLAAMLAEQVAGNDDLDPHYLTALRPFWFTVATVNLTDWQFWHSPRQPLRRVLHQLLLLGRGYSLSPHPASAQFPQRLHNRLRNLSEQAVAGAGSAQLLASLKSLYELLRHAHDQQRQSDRRLLELEDQSRRSLHAQIQASRAIRQAVWSQPVPASVVSFLDETWRKYLYLLHLKLGMQHPQWQQAAEDIQRIVWLACEATPQQLSAEVNGQLPGLLRRIREALAQTRTDSDNQKFPEVFAALLAARARNVPDAGLPLGELPDEPDDQTDAAQDSNRHDMPLRGACLLLKQGQVWQRVRVVSAPPPHDYVLLADFAGGRIAALSPTEWREAYSNGQIQPLPDHDPVMQLLPQLPGVLQPLLSSDSERRDRQQAEAAEQEKVAAAAAQRQREAQRAAVFEQRRQQEASERAERIANARREAEATALLKQQHQQATAMIDSLRGGALLELRRDDGQFRSCYLAMLRSADHIYVFVDRLGQKVAEHSKDELIALMLADGLRVIESGSTLDSALQNLVSERRQFLSDEEGS